MFLFEYPSLGSAIASVLTTWDTYHYRRVKKTLTFESPYPLSEKRRFEQSDAFLVRPRKQLTVVKKCAAKKKRQTQRRARKITRSIQHAR